MKKIIFTTTLLLSFIFVKAQIIETVAGGGSGLLGDGGWATNATLGYFGGMAIDDSNNIYICDGNNYRIRKVNGTTGIVTTIAGTGVSGYSSDNIPAISAQLNQPIDIALDKYANLFIYDYGNNKIRKVNAASGIITTYAGNGAFGETGDTGPATLASIDGGVMAIDQDGNMYVSSIRKIRKISSDGVITTYAGNGNVGITADGVCSTSTFLPNVNGICADRLGNIYISDSTQSIRMIAAGTRIIHRIAGTGDNIHTPFSGDGIPATSCHIGPIALAVDDTGNIYISDYANSIIEKVGTNGIIYTIAGTGVAGFSGDNGLAINAQISHPENVVIDRCKNVYVDDFNNRRVRKVNFHTECNYLTADNIADNIENNNEISLYPNPTTNLLNLTHIKPNTAYRLYNTIGKEVMKNTLKEGDNSISSGSLPPGMYVLELMGEDGERVVRKVVKSEP